MRGSDHRRAVQPRVRRPRPGTPGGDARARARRRRRCATPGSIRTSSRSPAAAARTCSRRCAATSIATCSSARTSIISARSAATCSAAPTTTRPRSPSSSRSARALARERDGRGVIIAAFDGEEPPHFLTGAMGSQRVRAHPNRSIRSTSWSAWTSSAIASVRRACPTRSATSLFALGAERSAGTVDLVDVAQARRARPDRAAAPTPRSSRRSRTTSAFWDAAHPVPVPQRRPLARLPHARGHARQARLRQDRRHRALAHPVRARVARARPTRVRRRAASIAARSTRFGEVVGALVDARHRKRRRRCRHRRRAARDLRPRRQPTRARYAARSHRSSGSIEAHLA